MINPDQVTFFSGDLRPYPGLPSSWSPRQREIALEVLDDLDRLGFDLEAIRSPSADTVADTEVFWEDACRLSAAARCTEQLHLVPTKTELTEHQLSQRLGPVSMTEEGGRHCRDHLLMHPSVLAHGGARRAITLLTVFPEPDQPNQQTEPVIDITERMAGRVHAGISHVIIKNAERKGGIWKIPTSTDTDVNQAAVLDALGWLAVRLEGFPGAFEGQDCVDMRWEYRCFVVDREVVTAAGCIEEYTPLDQVEDDGPFQVMLREFRGHHENEAPSSVVRRPDISARLLDFVREVARSLPDETRTVTIEVALEVSTDDQGGETSQPTVVELNDVPNSGLYASDVWRLYRSLALQNTAAARSYCVPPVRSAPTSGPIPTPASFPALLPAPLPTSLKEMTA